MEYRPHSIDQNASASDTEVNLLRDRKRRSEAALNRLKSLYLYSDSGMAEKDYITERQRIMLDIESVDKRLNELTASSTNGMGDPEDLIEKASYFIMADKILGGDYIDYGKYITQVDPKIPRAFIRTTVKKIVVLDVRVQSIEFLSGIKFIFSY